MKRYLLLFCPPIVLKLYKILVSKINRKKNPTEYKIGTYNLTVPFGFKLARNQKLFPLYDRYLPILASFLEKEDTIVDIGANFGDTAFGMLSLTDASIIAIEGSKNYFQLLVKNFELIPENRRIKYTLINELIGTGNLNGQLIEDGSTGHLVISNVDIVNKCKPLDEVLANVNSRISLIKVDTDGWDFDVLFSALQLIKINQPVLFWENEIHDKLQLNGYNDLIDKLIEIGYSHFFIFDNFGNFIFETSSSDSIKEMNSYLFNQSLKFDYDTIYYFDIVGVTEKNIVKVRNSVNQFKKEFNLV